MPQQGSKRRRQSVNTAAAGQESRRYRVDAGDKSGSRSEVRDKIIRTTDKTFRVKGLPTSCTSEADVETILQEVLQCSKHETGLRCLSLAQDHSGRTKHATVNFLNGYPALLESGPYNFRSSTTMNINSDLQDITVDDAFLGMTVLSSCSKDQHLINVIALSGIGGHAFGSFKARGSSYMWLRDSLPRHSPGSHVAIWGYESKIPASKDSQNLADIATKLMRDLIQMPEDVRSKGFIFISHSMGGLVVKRLLIDLSESTQPYASKLLAQFRGLLFCGVPSLGLDDHVVDSLLQMAENQPNISLLHSIRANSEFLELLHNRFRKCFNKEEYPTSTVYSLYETKLSPTATKVDNVWTMKGPEMLYVSKMSATSPRHGEESSDFTLAVNENHSNMVKFSESSEHYERVLEMILRIQSPTAGMPHYKWSDQERSCQLGLYNSDYEMHKTRNPDRVEGTCRWVLEHDNYNSWLNKSTSSLLWITADPGCGKSVLAKSLIDIDLKRTIGRRPLFFFFKDDNMGQRHASQAICALLHQLFSQKDQAFLMQYAISEYENKGSKLFTSLESLWNILVNLSADPNARQIVCVLDALDECVSYERVWLLRALEHFYTTQAPSPGHQGKLKFLVTSRPYLDIERSLSYIVNSFPEIRLEGELESEKVSKEIDLVIRVKVPEVATRLSLDCSEQIVLQERLLSMTHRTYLWLYLVFEDILNEVELTKQSVQQIVHRIPDSVDRAYEAILSRSGNVTRVRQLLCLIIAARSPLSVQELNLALAIDIKHKRHEDLEADVEADARFKVTMRALCGLFVHVINDKVYLLHQTAKEFLLGKETDHPSLWKSSIEEGQAVLLMTEKCINYLLFSDWARDKQKKDVNREQFISESEEDSSSSSDDESDLKGRFQNLWLSNATKCGFLKYATLHWTFHFSSVQTRTDAQYLRDSVLALYRVESFHFGHWYAVNSMSNTTWPPSSKEARVSLAAHFGHHTLLDDMLADGDLIDHPIDNMTPLLRAIDRHHEDAARCLIRAGATVDLAVKPGAAQSALVSAAGWNNQLLKLLLDAGANVQASNMAGWTALMTAAASGLAYNVDLLIKAGSAIDATNIWGETALLRAARCGTEGAATTVKLLLKAGAAVEVKDKKGRTPLLLAAKYARPAIIKALVKAGANKEITDFKGQTAEGRLCKRLDRTDQEVESILNILGISQNEGRFRKE